VTEEVIGGQLDGFLRGDEEDIDGAAPVHPEVAVCPEGFPEAVQHPVVHPLPGGPHLLVL